MNNKKTLVFAASTKSDRYSNLAVKRLKNNHFEAIPLGFRAGEIADIPIETEFKAFEDIHTVTLYINPKRQEEYYNYILSLSPKRIIFNPGTENPVLKKMANEKGIETLEACTLVLLNLGRY